MCNLGFISDLQHFSTGDGDGIRTTVFMQGCNLSCWWCHNPETIDINGSLLFYETLCVNCRKCEETCPSNVHSFTNGKHLINRDHCKLAGKCEQVCPQNALKVSGKQYELSHVMDYIMEDIDFYKKSNGGVTISGGEPLLQIDFCVELAKACFEKDINVIVDTAGNVPFEYFQRIIPYTKTFFYDFKANSEEGYREKIGGSYKLILENLKRLIDMGCDVVVRIPIIPGHNDTVEYMKKAAEVLKGIGAEKVQLLPFHRLGTAKYKALAKEYFYAETKPVTQEKAIELLRVFEIHDFLCKIDG